VIGVILLAVLMPRLHATADEVLAVITLCVTVIAAQAIIHLIAAYVRMSLLLNRVASGSSGQVEIRTGELVAEMNEKGERDAGGRGPNSWVTARATQLKRPRRHRIAVLPMAAVSGGGAVR